MEQILQFDFGVLQWIAAHLRTDWLTAVMQFITSLGNAGLIWIVLAVVLLFRRKTRPCGIAMLLALLLGLLIGNVWMKNFFARPRPFETFAELTPLIPPPQDYSFPSGHTLSSFAAATVIFCYFRPGGAAALLGAALIGFSRLYLCVHYPTDVLTGMLLGIVIGVVAAKLVNTLLEYRHFARIKKL